MMNLLHTTAHNYNDVIIFFSLPDSSRHFDTQSASLLLCPTALHTHVNPKLHSNHGNSDNYRW